MMQWFLGKLPGYEWKGGWEIFWIGLIAAGAYLGTVVAEWNPDTMTEWRTLIPAALSGAARAGLGAILAAIAARRRTA